MASTNKTPKLGLNQWAAGDDVLRTDFNADNLKIDALVGASACVVGSFLGVGSNNYPIELGFEPSFLIVFGFNNGLVLASSRGDSISVDGSNNYNRPEINGQIRTTSSGFLVINNYYNPINQTITYIAFR